MKRKIEEEDSITINRAAKQRTSDQHVKSYFRPDLFDSTVLARYKGEYSSSKPYKHGVIQSLLDPKLLCNVRREIQTNLSFTPKETDIYKIHQSGDLANLDGLEDSSLRLLPSLVTLRDALYSEPFRKYISNVAESGPLSGSKTDMAVNVYTPGCHLLCHDDVIGSRRVSYILYLTDPDRPWKAEWGGALRLFPTEDFTDGNGGTTKVPAPAFSVAIPPAFNQLAFFAVQPGESFHDVEEVYAADENEENNSARVRLAISGWYHIPQIGEEGYEKGMQEHMMEKSSLSQLQGKADKYDLPQVDWRSSGTALEDESSDDSNEMSEDDLDFLVRYMNPNYLIPDTLEDLSELFLEESSMRLASFLSPKFESVLRASVIRSEALDASSTPWSVARPPHKHRFLYKQPDVASETTANRRSDTSEDSKQLLELLNDFFPSLSFKKWLSLATGLSLTDCNIIARRFRRSMDYTLATDYEDDEPQLEVCLGLTPTSGWGEGSDESDIQNSTLENGHGNKPAESGKDSRPKPDTEASEVAVGGYEIYMAADEDDGSDHGITIPQSTHTGAGKRQKADPAIYKASTGDEDGGVLFSMPACWNTMSIVLRDRGILKFVKYVSKSAPGDRWDITGEWRVLPDNEDEDDD